MYPNLYFAFKDLFGVQWPFLQFANTFGFFVVSAFLTVGFALKRELLRKEQEGVFKPKQYTVMEGGAVSAGDLAYYFFIGFIFGYKFIGLLLGVGEAAADTQAYLFSLDGNWAAGIITGVGLAAYKWRDINKRRLKKPVKKTVLLWPHNRVSEMVLLAAFFGFIGAKILYNIQNWEVFRNDPVGAMLTFGGISFYGGFIGTAAVIGWYAKFRSIDFIQLCDAAAPGLMLAYAVIRLGCHLSGDGDWGIPNSAYVSNKNALITLSDNSMFRAQLTNNKAYYLEEFGTQEADHIPHLSYVAPHWLPKWIVAYNYPNNIINAGAPIENCESKEFCNQLPVPVYPTSFYESLMASAFFGLLWGWRKRITYPGIILGLYLIGNGLERFIIEMLRVSERYNFFGLHLTLTQFIAAGVFLLGLLIASRIIRLSIVPT